MENENIYKPDVDDPTVNWYVAVVRVNCEEKVALRIADDFLEKRQKFDFWIPFKKHVAVNSRGKKKVSKRAILSTFIFVRLEEKHLNDVRFRPDVYKMLTLPGQSAIYKISNREFYGYKRLIDNGEIEAAVYDRPLKKGQRVRIKLGNLKGLEAYVQRLTKDKAVIGNEIKFISGATITVDRDYLEII